MIDTRCLALDRADDGLENSAADAAENHVGDNAANAEIATRRKALISERRVSRNGGVMPFSSLNDPVDVARAQVAEDAVKRFVLANAPAYQHPRRVFFEKSMPLAATNKVDRAALRRAALQRIGETAVA